MVATYMPMILLMGRYDLSNKTHHAKKDKDNAVSSKGYLKDHFCYKGECSIWIVTSCYT